jgi:hypothetical protein
MKNSCFALLTFSILIMGACKAQKRSTPNYGSIKNTVKKS